MQMDIGEMIENEPMYKHTTYKVGGPCRLYVKVRDIEALKRLLKFVKETKTPYLVIGRGSNLLFSDKEYEGVVISLNECFNKIAVNGCEIEAEAGVGLIYLASQACKYGLSGLEFAGGIPGSVGGAVFMNAGAYLSEMANIISTVTILNEKMDIISLTNEQMQFSYRHSILQEHADWIVLSCQLSLKPGNTQEIQALMDKRKEKE